MALFPQYDTIPYLPGIEIIPVFNTSVSSLQGGAEKRRSKSTFPLYDLRMNYDLLTKADARTIWQFYKDRQGAYEAFYFYLPYEDTYEQEYCGTGDGSTTDFDVPGKTVSAYTVWVGGVAKSEGGTCPTPSGDYCLIEGGGVESAAQLEFIAAPVAGEHIVIDFTGLYRFKVRFEEDNLSFKVFYQSLTTMGIKLKGIR